jgi:hypothetical protein
MSQICTCPPCRLRWGEQSHGEPLHKQVPQWDEDRVGRAAQTRWEVGQMRGYELGSLGAERSMLDVAKGCHMKLLSLTDM